MNYLNIVREFVVENFLFGESDDLREDTSFLSSRIIDSTGILELVTFLEEKFGISIEEEEMIPENLDSLVNISTFLKVKLYGNTARTVT